MTGRIVDPLWDSPIRLESTGYAVLITRKLQEVAGNISPSSGRSTH